MIKFQISHEQKTHAWTYIKKHQFKSRKDQTDGSLEMQFVGYLGEIVFADVLNLPRPDVKGFDNGVDFEIMSHKVDIKTMARDCDYRQLFVNNIFASQVNGDRYLNDIYVFASINKISNMFELIGWIKKYQVQNSIPVIASGTPRTRKDGTQFALRGDTYEIPTHKLKAINSIQEFYNDLNYV